ncbi:uncharacterized protein H6S33_010971 [Morchella sextelata]|uniref:uncharacterized protein n=1 Tax=Morchella sextelata TaxID=1174677 RepID=UPI001D05330F|nr:uncharacterized protein H6S33_010971 [Morchella sextelata]KAH0611706.1 hypothetical protein H6S33_010971 [Morchella sextelata]
MPTSTPSPITMAHYIHLLTTQLTKYTSQGGHLHITQREATRKIIADADAYMASIGLRQHATYEVVVEQIAIIFRGYADDFGVNFELLEGNLGVLEA